MASTPPTPARDVHDNQRARQCLPKSKKTHEPTNMPSSSRSTVTATAKKVVPPDVLVAVEWSRGGVLLGVGTLYRPPDPQPGIKHDVGFGRDGLWAWHEYTRHPELLDAHAVYMAWIKIPEEDEAKSSLLYRRAQRHDCAKEPDAAMEGKKKKGMGTDRGMYRLTDKLYDELLSHADTLRRNCDAASKIFGRAAAKKMDTLDRNSIIRTIVADVREPLREYLDIKKACLIMRWGCLASFQDFDVAWTTFQRASCVMQAYLDFIGHVLPAGYAPALARASDVTPVTSRRGVILAGKDIRHYMNFYKRLGIPVWAYVEREAFDIPESLLGPADAPRCDVTECNRLNAYTQKILPVRWYPPPGCSFDLVEPIGRGYLPRPDEDTFELGQEAEARKRKLNAVETHQARKRAADERALARAKKEFGDLGASLQRYQQLTLRSPAARRYYADKMKTPRTYAPVPVAPYDMAETYCVKRYIDMLATPFEHLLDQNDPDFSEKAKHVSPQALSEHVDKQRKDRALLTWIPDTVVFTGPTSWEKTVRLVVNAVHLLPLILGRVELARNDPTVKPLGSEDWKEALNVHHWIKVWKDAQRAKHVERTLAQLRDGLEEGEELDEQAVEEARQKATKEKIEFETYDHAQYSKYGSPLFFGAKGTKAIIEHPNQAPRSGKLMCGCEATFDLLAGDSILVRAILTWFKQLRCAHWLSDLVSKRLSEEGIPRTLSDADTRYTPVFSRASEREKETVGWINNIAFDLRVMGQNGWPEYRSSGTAFGQWVELLMNVMLRTNDAGAIDQYMAKDDEWKEFWNRADDMEGEYVPVPDDFNDAEVDSLAEQMLVRYIVTSFAAKQWPVAFVMVPDHSELKCERCRTARPDQGIESTSGSDAQDDDFIDCDTDNEDYE